MAQALIFFHWRTPFSWQRSEIHHDRRIGQTSVSPPAEPGAYLTELTDAVKNKSVNTSSNEMSRSQPEVLAYRGGGMTAVSV